MSTKIETPEGWKITGDNIDELKLGIAAVHGVLAGESPLDKRPRGRPPGKAANGDEIAAQRLAERKQRTLVYLRAIQTAPQGIPASALVKALDIKNKNAIGSAAVLVNRLLNELGFKPETVYKREKKIGREKTWFLQPRITEAIAAIENLGK